MQSEEARKNNNGRKIIHIDMDAFYASIEQRDRPELLGKPIIVGGDPDKRGVVATCSYEARRYGIHSAMPSRSAARLCPQAIFVPPRFDVYSKVSGEIMQLFHTYTELVEPLSLDEAYLDVTTNKKQITSATQIARELKAHIYAQTGLTASAGVSCNKFIAKLASDYRKPDGITVILPAQIERFLEKMPVTKFFGVGKVTASKMEKLGIQTGADLKQLSEEQLYLHFQERGRMFYHYVRGEDERPVQPVRIRKSVGKETTLAVDLSDQQQMIIILERLAEQVAERLQELGTRGRTVTLKIKWSNFQLSTKSVSLPVGISQTDEIMSHMCTLLLATTDSERQPVRLLGLSLSNLTTKTAATLPTLPPQYSTLPLWENAND